MNSSLSPEAQSRVQQRPWGCAGRWLVAEECQSELSVSLKHPPRTKHLCRIVGRLRSERLDELAQTRSDRAHRVPGGDGLDGVPAHWIARRRFAHPPFEPRPSQIPETAPTLWQARMPLSADVAALRFQSCQFPVLPKIPAKAFRYRNMQAVAAPARILPWLPVAIFCAASCDRASIYASLAFNISAGM